MVFIHPLRFARRPCLRGTVCLRSERVSFPFSVFHLSVRSCTADVATLSAVTDSSPETGEVSQSDRGVDKTDFRFPFSPFRLSHATRRAKRSGNCREDGDEDVEYFTPGAVVVEGSHFVLD